MIDPDGYIARDPNAKLDNPVPASSRDAAINLPRNFCSQCGEPYLNADWYETLACGPSHAIIAAELRQSIRVQLAAPAAPPETRETAWLIGRVGPQWWTGRGDHEWTDTVDGSTTDPAKCAIRFARKEDAQRVICWIIRKEHREFCQAEEHIWG